MEKAEKSPRRFTASCNSNMQDLRACREHVFHWLQSGCSDPASPRGHEPAGTCFFPKERATTIQLLVNQACRQTAIRAATHHISRLDPGESYSNPKAPSKPAVIYTWSKRLQTAFCLQLSGTGLEQLRSKPKMLPSA